MRKRHYFFVLRLYEEMHKCWMCNQLHCKGIETKSLIYAGCKCTVYCSEECQVKHWKEGRHREQCEDLGKIWSTFVAMKKRVGRAIRNQRVYNKPIIVDGIEKECFLRPCEPVDYLICRTCLQNDGNATITSTSFDIYYENIAKLACGGKHPIFGNESISTQLEEKIQLGYENVISEFDPKSLGRDEIIAMASIAEALLSNEVDLRRKMSLSSIGLSIDRFLTLYICLEPITTGKHLGDNIAFGTTDKFDVEKNFLQDLKRAHSN